MKKNIIIALLLLCCLSGTAVAQDVSFAGKFGFNISTIGGSDIDESSALFGIHIGGLAEIPLQDDLYFQPEALISMQGADVGTANLNLTYLQFPLMGKYLITEDISIEAGPQIGVLLGDNSEDFLYVNTNSFDFAFGVGAGYRLNDAIYFQARHTFGLSKVIDDAKTRNGVFQISASYFF